MRAARRGRPHCSRAMYAAAAGSCTGPRERPHKKRTLLFTLREFRSRRQAENSGCRIFYTGRGAGKYAALYPIAIPVVYGLKQLLYTRQDLSLLPSLILRPARFTTCSASAERFRQWYWAACRYLLIPTRTFQTLCDMMLVLFGSLSRYLRAGMLRNGDKGYPEHGLRLNFIESRLFCSRLFWIRLEATR